MTDEHPLSPIEMAGRSIHAVLMPTPITVIKATMIGLLTANDSAGAPVGPAKNAKGGLPNADDAGGAVWRVTASGH